MVEPTVANASGIIAALVFVVQLLIPLGITFILLGFVREEDSASTWSVLGRTLQSTHWPLLLSSDTAGRDGVRRTIYWISFTTPVVLLLISLASIVTPLGLYDAILPEAEKVSIPFHYVEDKTAMGLGTPPRSNLGFNRRCWNPYPVNCPGMHNEIIETRNGSASNFNLPNGYDTSIPANVTEVFDSGREQLNSTVSSIWDIQWRTYVTTSDPVMDKGAHRIQGVYRPLQPLVLEDGIQVVEGLVVDTKHGGIGFRNHTVPVSADLKVAWSEDLLFVQPESVCVDTNLTLDFTLTDQSATSYKDLVLTDRGGFVHVDHKFHEINYTNPQEQLDLRLHAYNLAFTNNIWSMFYLNVTNPAQNGTKSFQYVNSHVGKSFEMPEDGISPRAIRLDTIGSFLQVPLGNSSYNSSLNGKAKYLNPFHITERQFMDTQDDCKLATIGSSPNIQNIGVSCGLMYGTAKAPDGAGFNSFNPGTNWSVPLYTCAAASKAIIKTVDFTYNGTAGLEDLHVVDTRDKVYARKEDQPWWAVEQREDLSLTSVMPLWGPVSPRYADQDGISAIQREYLWLPETNPTGTSMSLDDNVPAGVFHGLALKHAFSIGDNLKDAFASSYSETYDYSGQTNVALFSKWRKLCESAGSAADIIKLVWTDVAANAVVGTRAWEWSLRPTSRPRRDDSVSPGSVVQVPVTPWRRHLRYKVVYAIPAITVGALFLVVVGVVITLLIVGRSGLAKMRWYINHTSPGRLLTTFLHPDECQPQASTSVWVDSVGKKQISLKDPVPRALSVPSDSDEDAEDSQSNHSAESLIPAHENRHEAVHMSKLPSHGGEQDRRG
ncbi:hypothetical protein N7492_006564 [Penicillium capsulatum]|uniref:Uncharacterized protein n=1 Tax=Penicillium capsulatum TaxID=69766 RepID=A0A9W9I104_9EURO|nr:hypothetical protein N7492_006564 [Penicillium capsulatum]KAJ6116400.1 hypothetical protein N7512_006125 [Penicillium capsulatum]